MSNMAKIKKPDAPKSPAKPKTIQQMSTMELKALAFDHGVIIQKAQIVIQRLNEEIARREGTDVVRKPIDLPTE